MSHSNLISAGELIALQRAAEVLVVDCRFQLADAEAGQRAYAEAHIPGAVYAHLDHDLADLGKTGLGRHPLPDAEKFSVTLSRWGWHPGLRVVAYDDAGGALAAARLWWMLRLLGEREVSVLDGGMNAWPAGGGELESAIPQRSPSQVHVQFDASQLVDYASLQTALENDAVRLLDARAASRYSGEVEPIDAAGGHVPGALNRPFSDNLGADGRFKPAALLREEFQHVIGARAPTEVVHMCGSGVTACHNLLAMEHAGLTGSRIFAPSWSGWISDPARPLARGAEPG